MDMRTKQDSRDTDTPLDLEGSSPHHKIGVQSYLDLPGHIEFSQFYRYISDLPAQGVTSYQTADGRLAWRPAPHVEISVTGQNLLQPHHREFDSPGPAVGIRRTVFGAVTWRR
jgi:iron complex outermembrane receptor protein